MNITLMKSSKEYLIFLRRCLNIVLAGFVILFFTQTRSIGQTREAAFVPDGSKYLSSKSSVYSGYPENEDASVRDTVPEPRKVMMQSLILPGRGQITNKQTWKVPVIYGLLAGVAGYTVFANKRYQGYRAAYYNSFDDNTDQKFGPTPGFIPEGQPPEVYRLNRNQFRNNRDLSIIVFVLAYGLNVADAYIFAHLRDFDVSDDLSASLQVEPDHFAGRTHPQLTFRLKF